MIASPRRRRSTRERLVQVGVVVSASTILLSLAFFGVVALVDGLGGTTDRLPYYVLGAAAMFVGALLLLEERMMDGLSVLRVAAAMGIGGLVLFGLGVEGLRYVVVRPVMVDSAELVPYVVSAALIATGLGVWTVNHWRELVGRGF